MAKYISEFTGIEIDERLSKVNEEFTSEEKEKLAALENYDDSEVLAAVEDKVDKVEGKGLSTNDFTDEEKNKLSTLENYDDSGITKSIEDLEENKANKNEVYNKEETDTKITEKVAEIVAGAPEEFNTLKEMSDWLTEHEDSAATMNTAILKNKEDIAANVTAIEESAADIEQNKNDIVSAKSDIATINYAVGSPSKNFAIVRTSVSGESYGVVWTKNADESITINGTSTQNSFPIIADFTPMKIGKYYLSGCPKGGGQGSYQLYIEGLGYDAGIGVTLNVTELKTYRVKIAVYANYTYDNVTFYPMIRPADITDDTYEPYKPSVNERLTANEKSTIINQSTIGFQSKNILKNHTEATVQEHEGITYTINADGTIIANGTTGSKPSYCSLGGYFEIAETNDFILNGCATGGADGNWALQLYKQATPNDAVLFNDYGSGYSGKIEKGIYRGLIVIRANRTATNLTFKPMLRLKGTDDTYVPYVPTVNERLTANENDISLLEENKLNFAYFIAQNTTTTAGWYEVAKCDVIPSGGGIVRDITLCIQLTNANNTVGAKWAILNVAAVISKNNTTQSTIDTMVVSFIVNKGFNTSEDNPDIIVVGTTDGATVKLAIWCKLQVQHAYCRGIPLIDAARVSVKQFNTPNYWQMLNTTAKYDSYPTDWERKIIPTDYYGGQLKDLSDRITALENK